MPCSRTELRRALLERGGGGERDNEEIQQLTSQFQVTKHISFGKYIFKSAYFFFLSSSLSSEFSKRSLKSMDSLSGSVLAVSGRRAGRVCI